MLASASICRREVIIFDDFAFTKSFGVAVAHEHSVNPFAAQKYERASGRFEFPKGGT